MVHAVLRDLECLILLVECGRVLAKFHGLPVEVRRDCFSDQILVFAEAVLETIEEIEEELANILLLIDGNRVAVVIDNGLEYFRRILILDVAEQHAREHLLQRPNEFHRLLHFYFFYVVHIF